MIQKATLAGILMAGLVGLSGCSATMVGKYEATADGYQMALKDASEKADQTKKAGAEWRDIRWKKSKKNLFKQAADAAKAEDFEKAISILNKAQAHMDLSLAQAKDQANAGPLY